MFFVFWNGFKYHALFLEAKEKLVCNACHCEEFTQLSLVLPPHSTQHRSSRHRARLPTATANTAAVELSLSRQLQECRNIWTAQGNHTATPGFLFVANGEETTRIQQIHRALLVVPPTSVEEERVFSAIGLLLTKLDAVSATIAFTCKFFLSFTSLGDSNFSNFKYDF